MFNLPDDTNRLALIGMTGSGKTHCGLWHLSTRSFDSKPWIIFDFKLDENIGRIPGLQRIELNQKLPNKPGIYAVSPLPNDDDAMLVETLLWKIWQQENTGVFIDEGYMINRYSKGLRALLTQGRSKRTPIIMLSQRPSWISPFLLSEAEYLQLYFIHNPADVKTMREWMPHLNRMPTDFHSFYYDVKRNRTTHLAPMPEMASILQRFEDRRPKPRRPWL